MSVSMKRVRTQSCPSSHSVSLTQVWQRSAEMAAEGGHAQVLELLHLHGAHMTDKVLALAVRSGAFAAVEYAATNGA